MHVLCHASIIATERIICRRRRIIVSEEEVTVGRERGENDLHADLVRKRSVEARPAPDSTPLSSGVIDISCSRRLVDSNYLSPLFFFFFFLPTCSSLTMIQTTTFL